MNQLLQRIYIDQAKLFTQYPFSTTRRLEISGERHALRVRHAGVQDGYVGDTARRSGRGERRAPDTSRCVFAEPSVALVGDNSFSAFTSPGRRRAVSDCSTRRRSARSRIRPAIADYRRYIFLRPFTVAFRGVSLGRYGKGAEDVNTTWPIYLGDETLMRGYGYGSFTSDECSVTGAAASNAAEQSAARRSIDCSAAKWRVINAEFRIPLFGTEGFGLLNFPFLPTEVSPFFDAGVSYTNTQGPDFRLTREANDIPTSCSAPTNAVQRAAAVATTRAPIASRCSARACRSGST